MVKYLLIYEDCLSKKWGSHIQVYMFWMACSATNFCQIIKCLYIKSYFVYIYACVSIGKYLDPSFILLVPHQNLVYIIVLIPTYNIGSVLEYPCQWSHFRSLYIWYIINAVSQFYFISVILPTLRVKHFPAVKLITHHLSSLR